ncbi:MAG TPA: hypothetical protein VJ036_06405 [bacterium]|nr:hypothetical protein [bacterium]
MQKEVYAAAMAAIADIDLGTNDRIEALTGGHGMVNIATMASANAIAHEVLRGVDIKLTDENLAYLQVDDVLKKGIEAAKESGADGANAALIAATILYFSGSNAQAGVPAGNRKLGALARLLAGVDRCGVAAVPTPKSNNKISGFAAVEAIYEAMGKGDILPFDGRKLPLGVGAGPLYGHNVLGEDYAFPLLAREGAKIGAKAMVDAMAGAGITPSGIICAIIGAAAILEIVHPDSEVGEEYGNFFETNSAYLAGLGASEATGLPETLHMKGTDEEYSTAQLVGDLGIIIKDVGGPTVIGMMALSEMLAAFQEGTAIGAGFSGGPIMPPLGHMTADAIIALRALLANKGDQNKAADIIGGIKKNEWLDPELAAFAANLIARKTEQMRRGPVTAAIIAGTEGVRVNAVIRRAQDAYDGLKAGKSVKEMASQFDRERHEIVEQRAAAMLGAMTGREVELKITKLEGGSRRSHPFAQKYYGFDADVDVELTVDGKLFELEGLAHKVIPDAVLNDKEELLQILPLAAIPATELLLSGHTIINITVPAAVAAVMGKLSAKEAAKEAEKGAYVTAAIPGGKDKAKAVAELAQRIMNDLT